MATFTEAERHRIDELYARKTQPDATFTTEELELLSRYENEIAIRDFLLSEQNKERKESEQAILNAQLENERIARDNLNDLYERAIARLETFEHGK